MLPGKFPENILLAHGDGGLLTAELISGLFLRFFRSPTLGRLTDAALLPLKAGQAEGDWPPGGRLAFTTDSFVVDPVFFPGGDIGRLAVCGTVNDLAVSGARPLFLSAAFILEEGLPMAELETVVASMAAAATEAGVEVVAGDTKVVERGHADRIFISTAGIGVVPPGVDLGGHRVTPGDLVLLNGPVGEHGLAVLSRRQGLEFETPVVSDCAPLSPLVLPLLPRFPGIKFLRDPTRGGVATTVKELAMAAGVDVFLFEERLPVDDRVRGAAEMLGLDPLYLANEGKVVMVVSAEEAPAVLEAMRQLPGGQKATVIGEVRAGNGNAYLRTPLGATRVLTLLAGEQLPRIC